MRVTCSEFRANFGRYLDLTLTEPVIITNFARDQGVLISADIFRALRARESSVAHPALGDPITIPISDFQKRYAHYQSVASTNPIVITTHFREKTVLLSPEAFDALFEGSLPRDLDSLDTLDKVSTSDFQQSVGHYLTVAVERPLIITKHGREKNVLLSASALRILLCTKSARAEIRMDDAISTTATDLELRAGYYEDLAITKPVVVTVKEREQNVLISADAFKRLTRNGKLQLITRACPGRQLPAAELRGRYTYKSARNTIVAGPKD